VSGQKPVRLLIAAAFLVYVQDDGHLSGQFSEFVIAIVDVSQCLFRDDAAACEPKCSVGERRSLIQA
jgi:hypothetical protein